MTVQPLRRTSRGDRGGWRKTSPGRAKSGLAGEAVSGHYANGTWRKPHEGDLRRWRQLLEHILCLCQFTIRVVCFLSETRAGLLLVVLKATWEMIHLLRAWLNDSYQRIGHEYEDRNELPGCLTRVDRRKNDPPCRLYGQRRRSEREPKHRRGQQGQHQPRQRNISLDCVKQTLHAAVASTYHENIYRERHSLRV